MPDAQRLFDAANKLAKAGGFTEDAWRALVSDVKVATADEDPELAETLLSAAVQMGADAGFNVLG